MRIGFFTDSHFSSAEITCGCRYNSKSLEKINEAFRHFVTEKCDLVVCLGDLIDRENNHQKEIENLKKVSNDLQKYDIKTCVLMGNHDAFAFTPEEFYSILGEEYRPGNIACDNINLIFLDTCYFKNGEHYMPGDSDWTDTFLPKIKELETVLEAIEEEAYVFLHQNLDPTVPENHRVFNNAEIRGILQKSGKVKTVFQGHYHKGNTNEVEGIKYITFAAMCENDSAYYVVEI